MRMRLFKDNVDNAADDVDYMVATINSLERMEGDDNSDYNVDT